MGEQLSRRDFLKTLGGAAVLGETAFLEACRNLKEEELEAMSLTEVRDLVQSPEKFLNRERVKTHGWISEKGTRTHTIEQAGPVTKYTWQTDGVTYARHVYEITDQAGGVGNKLPAVSEEKIINFDVTPGLISGSESVNTNALKRKFPSPDSAFEYEIIGRVLKTKDMDKQEKYLFEIGMIKEKK